MKVDIRQQLSLKVWVVLAWFGIAGLGWMVATYFAGRFAETSPSSFITVLSGIGWEIAKAITIGSSLGIAVKIFFQNIIEPNPDSPLDSNGIKNLYPTRITAANQFLAHINDPRVTNVLITGISLRDFLSGGGSMQQVWEEIRSRLRRENDEEVSPANRLHVRLLLLDPQSGEGRFRYNVEKSTIAAGGLQYDIPIALNQVQNVLQKIYGAEDSDYLKIKLYEYGSFAHIFISDNSAFAEQYCYRDHTKNVALPLVEYDSESDAYKQLDHSCNIVWDKAKNVDYSHLQVGVAEAIQGAKIRNIYRFDVRDRLGRRQIEKIRAAEPGDLIKIQAITGRFYIQHTALEVIRDISAPKENSAEMPNEIQFLIMNPVSEQAILRAIADSCPPDDIEKTLFDWNWQTHSNSNLYSDAKRVMRTFSRLKELGHSVSLRLTPATLSASLLLTPTSAFIEQYLQGRSQRYQKGIVLGGEYPVIEYSRTKDKRSSVELEILESTFSVMWDSFSVKAEDYNTKDEQEQFEKSLSEVQGYYPRLKEEGNQSANGLDGKS